MRLRELQCELQRELFGGASAIAGAILDAPPLPVQARLGIYRNAYRSRLTDALGEVYPALHRLLGDETFARLADLFIEVHPSEHRSIRWYGRELAALLAAAEPFAGQPVFAELARFEWTLSEVFDAADAEALERGALAALEPERWTLLRFGFHPSLRRLALEWNAVEVWRALDQENEEEREAPAPRRLPEPVQWLLWRRDLRNYFRSMDAVECTALDAAVRGATFTEICEAMAAHLPQEEIPLRAAMLAASWIDGGVIASLA